MLTYDLTHDLRSAIHNDQIQPYFQPLVDLKSGSLAGFEVLSRWIHPQRGLVCPGKFIPLAEHIGAIGDLTRRLLAQSATEAASWPRPVRLAVNISPLQLRDTTLPDQIRDIASRHRLNLDRLTVEVTESALIDNLDTARAIAEELRAMGVQLALDDFGTGFSSLRHLQALPFTELKIDASFVRTLLTRRESRKIVAAVIGLGQSLGIRIVAEGVELAEQADMLCRLGCDRGQGWFYSRAQPASAVPALLAATFPPAVLPDPIEQLVSNQACLEASPDHRLAHLRAIYTGAPIGLCLIDRDLRFVNVNRQLAQMRGIRVSDYIGQHVASLLPDTAPVIIPQLKRALAGEAVSSLDLTWVQRTPPFRTILAQAFYQPVRDEAEEVIAVSVAVNEVNPSPSPVQDRTYPPLPIAPPQKSGAPSRTAPLS